MPEMGLVASIARRPIGSLVACTCLVILGLIAANRIPINLYPQTRLPALTVLTELADADPEEIETLITRKTEDALADLPGLKKMSSHSVQGLSRLILEFHAGRDVSDAAIEVRGRIRRLWPTFPKDTRFPVITHFNPNDEPVAVLAVTGAMSLSDLSHWAQHTLKPQLNRIKGVAAVQTAGTSQPEIKVICDSGRLKALGLTVTGVAAAIKAGHGTMPAGFLTVGEKRLSVRTVGDVKTAKDVAALSLAVTEEGAHLTVGDVARVELVNEEPHEVSRLNGKPLISVAVYRTTDADLRQLWAAIQKRIEEINAQDPSGARIEVIFSQAEQLQVALNRLKWIMALGAVVAAGTLFLFLGTISSTMIILAAIPFSMLVALLLFYLFGLSLDILSLSGLCLAVGIVVDSAIVVIESISLRLGHGGGEATAIVEGTEEVSLPVLFSTVATIMVFLPLVFVSHKIQKYFTGLTWTVSLSLVSSLVAALVLVPLLFRYFGSARVRPGSALIDKLNYRRAYDRLLGFVTVHPGMVLAVAAVFLVVAGIMATHLTYRQDWGISEPGFRVNAVMFPGTAGGIALKEAREAEKAIMARPGIKRVYTRIADNQARIQVTLDKGFTPEQTEAAMDSVRRDLKSKPQVEYFVLPLGQGGNLRTLSVSFFGPGIERLSQLATQAYKDLSLVPGVQSVMVHQANPIPEVEFRVQHDVVGASGIRALDLAGDLRSRLTGPIATRITSGEREIQVRVRTDQKAIDGLQPLEQAYVPSDQQGMIPFRQLAEPTMKMAPSEIHREDRRRVVRMSVVFGPESDPVAVAREVEAAAAKTPLPPGYSFNLGEEVTEILKTREDMLTAAGMSLLLIYLVLVAATESFLQPLVIMTAAPFAAGGVILALTVLGYSVNVPVYMGMLILCGLLANVNIVLVYAINDRLKLGIPAEIAVPDAGRRRLRPILMTTFTTVFASLPMLLDRGPGSATWAPFALTLATGLTASALFSLVFTPTAYLMMVRMESRLRSFRKVGLVDRATTSGP